MRDSGIFEHTTLNGQTIQTWPTFQYGYFGTFLGNPGFELLNKALDKLAKKYGVSQTSPLVSI
ncbi:hypothetical protein [Olsenella sp. Marseille-P4559]|uniref:hypothetical protein n=1 Tax=Olsenella sp. Marseille-P4559 TaxID=2364795 RepID=UPI001030A0BE|nr:hypothetical protein [Olsenella sp. Marseille-P4559]